MPNQHNLYLIGPMGAGKSSIGLQLAKIAKLPFYDSDRELEKHAGVDIDWIYDVEGSMGLVKREKNTILDLIQQQPIVLSTGGGSVTIPEVREALQHSGIVIYLKVPFDAQLQRTTRRPQGRPQLSEGDHKQRLLEINREIEPIYESLATLTYQATRVTPMNLAKRIWHDVKKINEVK